MAISQPTQQSLIDEPVKPAPIADFGEKIVGAKKELWASYQQKMAEAWPDDLNDITLSKHFPEPDYKGMVADGVDIRVLAAIKAMRDEIPAKPKLSYKLKTWADQVKVLREFSMNILEATNASEGVLRIDNVLKRMREFRSLGKFADRIELYAKLGYPLFTKAGDYAIRPDVLTKVMDKTYPDGIERFIVIHKMSSIVGIFNSEIQALDALRAKLEALQESPGKSAKLDIYTMRSSGDTVIGKKIASGKYIDLKTGFKTPKEAIAYLKEHEADLLIELEHKKTLRPERRDTNRPRVGPDHRQGVDVTPELFSTTFGFRGIQFGNYVEQSRRVEDLNNAHDAFLDLAGIINVPPRALSLNGELGIAFGARGGRATAGAHYELNHVVINLTKTRGAGALAHEFFHALDNYFSRKRGDNAFVTQQPWPNMVPGPHYRAVPDESVRPELLSAFKNVVATITASEMYRRSQELDSTRTRDYWSTPVEMAARAFESYIIDKAAERGQSNDYLANILSEEAHNVLNKITGKAEAFSFPTASEKPAINAAFDKLFSTMQAVPSENGNIVLGNVKQGVTGSPAFKAWFGDSKAVDADGRPLLVFHGTGADIAAFEVSEGGTYGGGIYLTPDVRGANEYAIHRGAPSSTVYPLHVSIKNPATGAEAAHVASWHGEANARAILIERGFDGVIDHRSGEIVAFYPEQVKSAIGNNGTFSPLDQNILGAQGVTKPTTAPAHPAALQPALDQQILSLVKSGKGVPDILQAIADSSNNVQYRELAQQLLSLNLGTSIEFIGAAEHNFAVKGIAAKDFAAGYVLDRDAILLFSTENIITNVLHELVHASTAKAIRAGGAASREMLGLYDYVKNLGALAGTYGMENVDEFVAEAFSNPRFQAVLNTIPALQEDGSDATAWACFKSIIKTFLGLKADTVLDQVLAAGERLMAENQGTAPAGTLGKNIDQTKTVAFRKWFGESKVTDADGKALAVYHGTGVNVGNRGEFMSGDFDTFNADMSGKSSKTGAPEGSFFFTDKPDVASSYTVAWRGDFSERLKDGANVMPVYLAINKPLKVNAKGENWREILYKGEYLDLNEIVQLAKESGKYDGVILSNVIDKGVGATTSKTSTTYIAFEPEQIKSAIGNNGNFDPNDANILTNNIDQTKTVAFRAWFGDSKAVEPDGSPMLVFHNTDADFTEFKEGSRSGLGGKGIYFSEYPLPQFGSRQIKAYLRINNPITRATELPGMREINSSGMPTKFIDDIFEKFPEFDGIINRSEIVVKSPSQIKSATDNNGNFDPNDANILARNTDQEKTPAFREWFGNSNVIDRSGKPLVMYHGTTTPDALTEFLPGGRENSRLSGDAYGVASYFTSSASEASNYARDGGAVLPVYVRGEILDVDSVLSEVQAQRVTEVANKTMLPSDKARFQDGRVVKEFDCVKDARQFFDSQRKNWDAFGDGMDRARPEARAENSKFQVEHTDFEAPIKIKTGEEALTFFKAVGFEHLRAAGFDGMMMRRDNGQSWVVMHNPDGNVKSAIGNNGNFDPNDANILARNTDQEKTPAFRQWFGASKAIDKHGNPARVFHGSTRGGITNATVQQSFFTSDREVAQTYSEDDYASSKGNDAVVQEAYLRIKNPLEVDALGEEWMRVPFEGRKYTTDDLANLAKRRGHDGLIVRNVIDNVANAELPTTDIYVTLGGKAQIKSATDNNGNFDTNSSHILAQNTDQTKTVAFRTWFAKSRVVDQTGEPLALYHGTTASFAKFDLERSGEATGHKTAALGVFFTADTKVANLFAGQHADESTWPVRTIHKEGANVVPVYLTVQNPLVMPAKDFVSRFVRGGESAEVLRRQAVRKGFDGILIQGDADLGEAFGGDEYGADTWVAFDPKQVTSAISTDMAQAEAIKPLQVEPEIYDDDDEIDGETDAPRM